MFEPKTKEFESERIISESRAVEIVNAAKKANKTIGLCVGEFDMLHPGQILHFKKAKEFCDILIVGVSGNSWVKKRKGEFRPIFNDMLRAFSLSQLKPVDYVIINDHERAIELIEKLKPNYYIKGPDYIDKQTPGITAEREAIKRVGGEMKYTEQEKLSTTEIINYIKNVFK